MTGEEWLLLASIVINGAVTMVSLIVRHRMPYENGGKNGKT